MCYLSLLDIQVLQSPYTSGKPFAPSSCKTEKWKQLLFLRMTDCFDEARSPLPEMSKALPFVLFLTRLWKDSEGRTIALFNDILKVNILHLQTGKVDHSLAFAHPGSCFHKSDSCWRYSCFAPVTLDFIIRVFIPRCARKCLALCGIIIFSFFCIYFFPNKWDGDLHNLNFVVVPPWKGS